MEPTYVVGSLVSWWRIGQPQHVDISGYMIHEMGIHALASLAIAEIGVANDES